MTLRYSMGSGALIGALLTSTASFADVTPAEVWENWREYMETSGYAVTATENMDGSSLTISDMTMAVELPEDGGSLLITFGELGFIDQGDGTVAISLPESWPINAHIEPTDEDPIDVQINYASVGLSMITSGTPEEMAYNYSADELTMSLAGITVEGVTMGPDAVKAVIRLGNLAGTTLMTTSGMLKSMTQSLTAASLSYEVDIHEPGGSGNFAVSGQTVDLVANTSLVMPENVDMQDIDAALKAGLDVAVKISSGAGSAEFNFVDGEESASGSSVSTGVSFGLGMDANHMQYGLGVTGVAYHLVGSDIPFPVNFAANEVSFDFTIPVAKSDTPGEFALLTKIVDFAPDAMIWSMADPTGSLPHDPATVIVDVAGQMNWLFDILDPAQAAMMEDVDVPAEIHALTLKDITVSAAGAMLTGAGSFTFDNSDLETFDGVPAPDGSLDVKVVGANGLIDALIGMGLMSDDDAMGARMMLGLFGRPGEGEDTVLSTIEIKPNGQIFANGQRLQ